MRERLQIRGVRLDAEEAAVATLANAGYIDDAKLARGRAQALAEKGWGDAAIRVRLVGEGLPEALVTEAVGELEPEPARAANLSANLPCRKAWGLLQRRGFDQETIEAVLSPLDEESP